VVGGMEGGMKFGEGSYMRRDKCEMSGVAAVFVVGGSEDGAGEARGLVELHRRVGAMLARPPSRRLSHRH